MIARSLSQFLALALAALLFWCFISSPGVMDPEYVVEGYAAGVLTVAVVFGLLFVALRFATAGSAIYWSGGAEPKKRLERIGVMIGVMLAVHIGAGWIFDLQGRLGETADIVSVLTSTLVPAAFLALGIVKWPSRLKSASTLRLALVGAAAIGLATTVSYAKFANGPDDLDVPSIGGLSISLAGLIVAAAAEEVVWRILLLTALLDVTASRFQAVFLSGVAFGLMHAPLALMQPVVRADWPMLQYAANAYAPELLLLVAGGLFLAVLWLRTGSIALVVLTHSILNVGPDLMSGL
ncbi:CPBP family intramembrane glutamic endopeptidase [Brevundimonas sp.]|uniref:CPBP family intramembrane glutamic endopeptidase n=1 Tax=Brevundimonas sp. TaxID=1871086 RepID=UPI002FC6CAF2